MSATHSIEIDSLISSRGRSIDASGIRRVFELGATLKDPCNFSIGQPDFPVPAAIKSAAVDAIHADRNGYTVTQGSADLIDVVSRHLKEDVGWSIGDDLGLLITSGTSGAIFLACLALLDPGDEVIVPDPWFVVYPVVTRLAGGTPVVCDTYPDFRMTAERVEPLITERTKMIIIDSPGNPTGVVLSSAELRDLVALCEERGIILLSDEIYDAFTYGDAREDGVCPSPARMSEQMLLVRGFGKTYGCTGWRMGYAAGPKKLIEAMAKMQQYTFVCAPSIAQAGVAAAFDVDMSEQIDAYQRRRDRVIELLGPVTDIVRPGGAFYCFIEIPERVGMTGMQFAEAAIERNVLVIPGGVFSDRDTHFRLSYATRDEKLEEGLAILAEMLAG